MKLIVGLGNPGDEYKNTRHNVGFIILDALADKLSNGNGAWNYEKKLNCEIFKKNGYLLAKPQTFMNASGKAVAKLVNYFDVTLDDLIVVHDDVDMEFGKTRFKKGMGSGGHHGVENIIENLSTKEFWRLRVGIGRPANNKFDIHAYVLSKCSDDEIKTIQNFSHLLI